MTVEYLRAIAVLKDCSVPQLSGAMRVMTKHDEVPGKHKIEFLGIIDLPSTDMSCVYTTLLFVEAQHKKMKLPGLAVCTFDQPLWQKAMIVKAHMNIHMVIMLGNFHVQMSFLGSIGYVMTNSGLEKAHISIYGEKSVKKIINGKEYERSMRANSLAASALRMLLLQQIPEEEQYALEAAELYFKSLMENDNKSTFWILEGNPVVDNLMEIINESRESLSQSPLNKLFFTYLDMNDILTYNYIAERLGDWTCYLESLKMMLPYLAAIGHTQSACTGTSKRWNSLTKIHLGHSRKSLDLLCVELTLHSLAHLTICVLNRL